VPLFTSGGLCLGLGSYSPRSLPTYLRPSLTSAGRAF